jgi:hypothetical protein
MGSWTEKYCFFRIFFSCSCFIQEEMNEAWRKCDKLEEWQRKRSAGAIIKFAPILSLLNSFTIHLWYSPIIRFYQISSPVPYLTSNVVISTPQSNILYMRALWSYAQAFSVNVYMLLPYSTYSIESVLCVQRGREDTVPNQYAAAAACTNRFPSSGSCCFQL